MSIPPGRRAVRPVPVLALALALALPAAARVVSYAPVTDRTAIPAVQRRASRHYLLMELDEPMVWSYTATGRLVLYDAQDERDPRVVLPTDGASVPVPGARLLMAGFALREGADGVPVLLALTNAELPGDDSFGNTCRYLLSTDAGATWRDTRIPPQLIAPGAGGAPPSIAFPPPDTGGPVARERGSQIRLGSEETPFFVTQVDLEGFTNVWAVPRSGTARRLATGIPLRLVGSKGDGSEVLATGNIPPSGVSANVYGVWALDATGGRRKLLDTGNEYRDLEGWITPSGAAYAIADGRLLLLDGSPTGREAARDVYLASPTADYAGAWIVQRGPGQPTVLSRHAGSTLVEMWRDVTGPEVEAVIPGGSGRTLLVQVHRARPQVDQRTFKDPALAVWTVGEPAPRAYDELFLNEYPSKGFVNVDVDRIALGDPFTFDSGSEAYFPAGGGPSAGGGADVVQEWGVVRGSLRQRLVLPAVARTSGAFGASWRTDLLLRNPHDEAQTVTLSLARQGSAAPESTSLRLAAGEIRVVPDVLGTLFSADSASGALFLTPDGDRSVNATSRTYTQAAAGTYGMSVGAIDVFAAASPRFPMSYAAALQGERFRTNVIATDLGGRGAQGALALLAPDDGSTPRSSPFSAPAAGQRQTNGLAGDLGMPAASTGGVQLRLSSGRAIASVVVIDNLTNDPTYFPPDLPAPTVRVLPAIVDVDGRGDAHWRTDLFLVNTTNELRSVLLLAKSWSDGEAESRVTFTLLPRESRVIPNALATLFGKHGVARLRFDSSAITSEASSDGVRLTSRVYTKDSSGGTYGFSLPPLNSFQAAGGGEALEILGPAGGPGLRTNLALVDLTAFADGTEAPVRVEVLDEKGALVDRFDTSVPIAGGRQIDDLFRARGLGDGPKAALIRISPARGLVAAYATLIDGGTGDPTFYGAALASR